MALRKFPALRKLAYSSTKKQKWNTKIQKSGSGKVRTLTNQLYPEWTITAKLVKLTNEEARKLMGFAALLKGAYTPFLWLDPEDYEEKGIQLPLVTNGTYQAVMKMGDYVEPVAYIEKVTVYLDGKKQASSAYSVTDGLVKFKTAPASSAKVTADYTYYWKVMFEKDEMEIENIFVDFNKSKTFKMVTVR